MNRLWELQTENFYDRLLAVSVRDEIQPKCWEEFPWDENRFRPIIKKVKIGPSAELENLEGDAWNEYIRKQSAALLAEQAESFIGYHIRLEVDKKGLDSEMTPTTSEESLQENQETNSRPVIPAEQDKEHYYHSQGPVGVQDAKNENAGLPTTKKVTSGVTTRPVFKFMR